MSKPSLFALLVGVGDYASPNVSSLHGTVNDARLMQEYLESDLVKAEFSQVHLKSLHDKEATKTAIVDGFQSHLAQAKPGDTALFFFAGHGVREKTDIALFTQDEIDGHIAGIVCYDSDSYVGDADKTTLSDKEMRYLISTLVGEGDKKVHVLTLFDCCHSGSNTRSAAGEQLPPRSRQVSRTPFNVRPWEGFVFYQDKKVNKAVKETLTLNEALPLADHVMIAACREVELAWEAPGKDGKPVNGAFTLALVEVLKQNKGRISYHELHSRVLNRMRFVRIAEKDGADDVRQTPQVFVQGLCPADRYNCFLTNQANEQPSYGAVAYNEEENEWRFDLGALHGVPTEGHTPVKVYPAADATDVTEVSIKHVFPTHSVLDVPDSLKTKGALRGEVVGLGIPPLKIYLTGEAAGVELAKQVIDPKLKEVATQLFQWAEDEQAADWVLMAKNGAYRLALPFDNERARIADIPYLDSSNGRPDQVAALTAFNDLSQLSRWSFLRDLNHNGAFLPRTGATGTMFPVELRVFEYDPQTKRETRVLPKGNLFTFELEKADQMRLVRFELMSWAEENLHASLVSMPHTFGFVVEGEFALLPEPQVLIGPMKHTAMQAGEGHIVQATTRNKALRQHCLIDGKQYFPLAIGKYVIDDNWDGYSEYLKLIVSEIPFNLQALHMAPLPPPGYPRKLNRFGGISFGVVEEKPPQWQVSTYEFFVTNPVYEPVTAPIS